MIKIADYTEKLDRLNRSGRDNEAKQKFDRICEQLFGATLDDITEEDYSRRRFLGVIIFTETSPMRPARRPSIRCFDLG